jgi:predicted transcriptional regulator
MKDKQVAIQTISQLPENASMDEIAEELQIMAAIRKGKADVKAGRVKSQAQVERLFETWISK